MILTENKVSTIANANDTIRISMKEITQNIESAYEVVSPNPSSPTSTKLTIQTDSSGDTISFFSQNGNIYSQYNDNSPSQISSSNVYTYSLTFTEEANTGLSPTIFISITEKNFGLTGVSTTKTYETTATQRRQ